MKKTFFDAKIDLIRITNSDIITTSPTQDTQPAGGGNGNDQSGD